MKWKLIMLLALVSVGFNSCSISDDDSFSDVQLEIVAVTAVEFPAELKFGEINNIIVRYDNPTTCNRFEGFNVDSTLNQRTVSIVTTRTTPNNGNCAMTNLPTEQILRFLPTSNGSYVFRFLSGQDANNEPTYLEFTVEVVE